MPLEGVLPGGNQPVANLMEIKQIVVDEWNNLPIDSLQTCAQLLSGDSDPWRTHTLLEHNDPVIISGIILGSFHYVGFVGSSKTQMSMSVAEFFFNNFSIPFRIFLLIYS